MRKALSLLLSFMMMTTGVAAAFPLTGAAEGAPIRLYQETPGAIAGRDFEVTVEGIAVPVEQVYDIGVARFVYLQTQDTLTVTIKSKKDAITTADVYPHSLFIPVEIDPQDNTLTFRLSKEEIGTSLKLIIGINDDTSKEMVLLIDTPEADTPQVDGKTVKSVLDYAGVKNDGTLCTQALQTAIDAAGDDPQVEVLYFPAGTYLTGRLVISKDNTRIYLAEGALIKGSDDLADYPNGETGYGHHDRRNGSVFIHVLGTKDKPVRNVKLFGHGVIDGSGMELEAKWHSLNLDNQENWIHLFEGKYVDGLVVEDITMRNSSNWGCKIENAQNVTMNRVNVLNPFAKVWSDGIDISSSVNCEYNGTLSYVDDDSIAIMTLQLQENGKEIGDLPGKTSNITFNNHLGRSACSGVRLGWDSSDRIEELYFNNCEFALAYLGGINFHCLKNDNAFGKIVFNNCRWDRANVLSEGRFITCFSPQYQQAPVKVEDLQFRGCVIEGLPASIHLNGAAMERVLFDSVQMTNGTGLALVRSEADIPNLSLQGDVELEFADSLGLGKTAEPDLFEAEAMRYSQVQTGTNATGFDGFGYVKDFCKAGSALYFDTAADITATYPLAIRYRAETAVSGVALYVDGAKVSDLIFPQTSGEEWGVLSQALLLAKGDHEIKLQSDSGATASLLVDSLTFAAPNKWQAEDAAMTDAAVETVGVVTAAKLAEYNAALAFSPIASADRIAIRYKADFDTELTLKVGDETTALDMHQTDGTWETVEVDVTPIADGKVELIKSGKGAPLYIDGIYALNSNEIEEPPVAAQNLVQALKGTSTYRSSSDSKNASAVDNDPISFWWGDGSVITTETPQFFEVAFGQTCEIEKLELALPPLNYWPDRIQEMRILASADGTTYEEIVPKTEYFFSLSENGNKVTIPLDAPVQASHVKIEFYQNVEGGNQGQIGELYIWGTAPGKTDTAITGVNLALNKALTLTPSAMVFGNKEAAFDGNASTFFDCGSANFPSALTVDLAGFYQLKTIVMKLPEHWGDRHQEIAIEVSLDGETFTQAVTKRAYFFTGAEKNMVTVTLDAPARYVRLTGYSNDEVDHPGFQLGELEIYGGWGASVEGVTFDQEAVMLAAGESVQLTATVLPENGCDPRVAWSSSDVSVATVDHHGVVTAVSAGFCTVRVRTLDGDYVDTLTVTVTEAVTPSVLYGDVNGDGKVDSSDARIVLQSAVGKVQLDETQQTAADVNGDNKIDSSDARYILQKSVNKVDRFPVEE